MASRQNETLGKLDEHARVLQTINTNVLGNREVMEEVRKEIVYIQDQVKDLSAVASLLKQ